MPAGSTRNWTLWLTCDVCGDIELTAGAVILRYACDDGRFSVTYRCAHCGRRDCVDVNDSHALGALFAAGLAPTPWKFAPEQPPRVALAEADVGALVGRLHTPGWLDDHCPRP